MPSLHRSLEVKFLAGLDQRTANEHKTISDLNALLEAGYGCKMHEEAIEEAAQRIRGLELARYEFQEAIIALGCREDQRRRSLFGALVQIQQDSSNWSEENFRSVVQNALVTILKEML